MKKSPSIIEDILYNPIFQLIIALILAAFALSGKLSMIAAGIFLFFAWSLIPFVLWRSNCGVNWKNKHRVVLIIVITIISGILLFLLNRWINKPIPQIDKPPLTSLSKIKPGEQPKPPMVQDKEARKNLSQVKEPKLTPGANENLKGKIKKEVVLPSRQEKIETSGDVALRFIYSKSPALVIINQSDSVARDIKWTVQLWNMDLPERNDPLPIPIQIFDWIKAHDQGGPQNLFGSPSVTQLLTPGNRLFGSASVNCPTCARGRTYIIYIVWGQGGWVYEVKEEKSGHIITPVNFLKDAREEYFKYLEAKIPENLRLPIGER